MKRNVLLCSIVCIALFASLQAKENFKVLKQDGGWCWFQCERALAEGENIFFGSVKSPSGDIDITSWDTKSNKITTTTLDKALNSDDHAAPGLLKLDDNNILALWSSHGNAFDKTRNGVMYYARTKAPSDISSFTEVKSIKYGGCYNNVMKLSEENGRIYDMTRAQGWNPHYWYSDDNGESFKYGGRLLFWETDKKDPKGTSLDGNRPYVKYTTNGRDKIFFTSTEAHPRGYDNSIYCGFIKGGKMFDSFGKEISELSKNAKDAPWVSSFTKVFDGNADNVAWTADIRLDKNENPVVLFSVQKDCGYLRHNRKHECHDIRYYYAIFNGDKWIVSEMAHGGTALYDLECDYSGLCAIDTKNVNRVYISTNADPVTGRALVSTNDGLRHYEIFKGETSDMGRTWKWVPVTKNSKCDNLRPIVPLGFEGKGTVVLWCRGKLTDYCHYKLDIVGLIDKE